MKYSDQELIDNVLARDLRAVSRLITLIENGIPRARAVQSALYPHTGKAHVIGITGSPGAGKSTLVDCLAMAAKVKGHRVGILAIDPTSPFSGGAILGDRIRMTKTSEDATVFIRSMATRGALGGISRATLDAIQVLDAAGFDTIIVETVGVGQAEVDIVRTADTCLVVMVPGMGDEVQAFKAGIVEIADIFVINKADRDGADLLHKDLRVLLSLVEYGEESWKPPIVSAIATRGEGIASLMKSIADHELWLRGSSEGKARKVHLLRKTILGILTDTLTSDALNKAGSGLLEELLEECYARKIDPFTAAQRILARART